MDLFTQYIVAGIVSLPIWIVFGFVLSAAMPEWVNAPRRVAWAGVGSVLLASTSAGLAYCLRSFT